MGHFDLKVGFYCCQDCVHCVVEDSREYGNLSLAQIRQTISNIPYEDCITITGGEPTIRPDFMKILRLCQNHRHISLQTNGLGLTEEVCVNLKQFKIHVLLTIHSCDKGTYLKVSRGPEDGYEKAINAAKYLTKYCIPWTWQIVVHKLNKDTVLDTFQLAKSINSKVRLKFTYPHPMGNAYNKKLLCTLTELKPLIREICETFGNSVWFEQVPFCFLEGYENIMKESRVNDPEDKDLGLRFENNLKVRPYYMSETRTKSKKCSKCAYINYDCPGIYNEYKEFFGDKELIPVKENALNRNYMFSTFNLWLFMTTRCNCNCEYCKQGGQPELRSASFNKDNLNTDMTRENLKYIFDECVKSHEKCIVKQFHFNLSGGEPFLVFDMFSEVISNYKKKYPKLFSFSSSTNGILLDEKKIEWIKNNYTGGLFSMDSLTSSKPINRVSSSNIQIKNAKKLKEAKCNFLCLSVFDKQTIDEMLTMAEFAINNFKWWRILLATPIHHTKDQILNMAKPVLKYLYEHDFYSPDQFDFDTWDLWNRKQTTGCPCGRSFLGILPNLEVSPTNGENLITLGKFSWNIPEFINKPENTYYRENFRPEICQCCELKDKCDGSCRANHKNPEMLKERCDSIKELFEYVQTLKK
jgi:radical SAM protein with 4Fe4S-binding SPASM domain